ncbi:hypothetical protein E3P99_02260 [Wallemia hederae]|uniref:RAVE complex protein Rav1 C-terminal domain-containing protein n=1 Tax=Wallemia hederae TaxID=1540922 RepID=A0A4T0FML2_9BASI|nr:hypothetical protein E3P99_02260 [Wallemia hederae]
MANFNDQIVSLKSKILNKNNLLILIHNGYFLSFNFNFILVGFLYLGDGVVDYAVFDDFLVIQYEDSLSFYLDSDLVHTIRCPSISQFTHRNNHSIIITSSSIIQYNDFMKSSSAPLHHPQIPSLSPNCAFLAVSQANSPVVHLYSTSPLTHLQSLPHLSPIRSLQWRDSSLLIVETTDNDLYAYIQSSPVKFEPWTIYVSPSLLRSFWLGPQITDLLLRRALSDSNYLFHQNNQLSNLIATRRYESVSQISQFSRDLILNISSDGYNLSINAINDTSHSTSNYIRSSPIVQLTLNEYIPNDIIDIKIICESSYSPIYILAVRSENRGVLVGVLNPASIFDPVPDTTLHPPIQWLRSPSHVQHMQAITNMETNASGSSLSTYSKEDRMLIHWSTVDTPSNAMHKLRVIESSASFKEVDGLLNFIHVEDVTVMTFSDSIKVYRGYEHVETLPTSAHNVLLTNTSTYIHIVEQTASEITVTWLALNSCSVAHKSTQQCKPAKHLALASKKQLKRTDIPSYKSRSRSMRDTDNQDGHPLLTSLDADGEVTFLQVKDRELRCIGSSSSVEGNNVKAIETCAQSRHLALVTEGQQQQKVLVYNSRDILEHEYTTKRILNLEFLSLADYSNGLLLLVNEGAFARVLISTNNPQRRWTELTRLVLPVYESGPIEHAAFLSNGTVVLTTDANMHIQSVAHLLSDELRCLEGLAHDDVQETAKQPLRQLSLYEIVADVAGPVQEWHPAFMARCIDLGYFDVLKAVLGRLRRALIECDTGDMHDAFICDVREGVQDINHNKDREENDDDNIPYPSVDDRFVEALPTIKGVIGSGELYDTLSNMLNAMKVATERCLNGDAHTWKAVYYAHLDNAPHSQIALFAVLSTNHQLIADVLSNTASALATHPSIWLDEEPYRAKMEIIAKKMSLNSDEAIDPTLYGVSVIYFALQKKSAVITLWKYAYGNRERESTINFLNRDFDGTGEQCDKNRVAATKNAYALLSKHRYDYAAAFFILAHKHADATRVLIKHCKDYELALLVARLSGDTDLYQDILKETAKDAFTKGDSALLVAALLKLNLKSLASKCLLDVSSVCSNELFANLASGNSHTLNLALVGLYNAQAIPKSHVDDERGLVVRCANDLARDGCDVLAVRLLSSWRFGGEEKETKEKAEDKQKQEKEANTTAPTPQTKTNVIASQPKQSSQHVDQFDMSAFGF